MNNKIFISIIGIITLFLACNNSSNPIYYSTIGTIESERTIYLDEDSIVHAQQNFPAEYKRGDRVIVDFTILEIPLEKTGVPEVQVSNIRKILTDAINIIPVNDNLFNDSIAKIDRMWLSKGYVTMDYTYSAYDTAKHKHKFRLSKFENENTSLDTITLHFRHNTDKDSSAYKIRDLLSFNISDLKPLPKDSVLLIIKTKLTLTTSDTRKFIIKDSLISFEN